MEPLQRLADRRVGQMTVVQGVAGTAVGILEQQGQGLILEGGEIPRGLDLGMIAEAVAALGGD